MSEPTNVESTPSNEESFRDRIGTMDEDGKRKWIFAKKPSGTWYNRRTVVSYVLLAILFALPFIKVNGEPLLLLNIIESRFILFGFPFTTQDFHIAALMMITVIIFIVLFTVVFGRLFCGWICPQTIFMEMVFRKIEYWIEGDRGAQMRLARAPWTFDKIRKKVTKQAIFILISLLITHTFLSYIIGYENVWEIITQSPAKNWTGFAAMVVFTGMFYGVFSYMREQVCIAVCPYGRLQGVMMDKHSQGVWYDWERGEPRGRMKKKKKVRKPAAIDSDSVELVQLEEPQLGDCIDCKQCVVVCPTGIDIRNGSQMECVNCTACMDACDEVMIKIGRPTELIRYDSYEGIKNNTHKIWNTRSIAYSVVLGLLLILNAFLITTRSDMETLLLRTPGVMYQETEDGRLSNLYNYQLVNKTRHDIPVTFKLVDEPAGEIKLVGDSPNAVANDVTKGALFIILPRSKDRSKRERPVKVDVYSGDKKIDRIKTNFLQPFSINQ